MCEPVNAVLQLAVATSPKTENRDSGCTREGTGVNQRMSATSKWQLPDVVTEFLTAA
jgi:hypothetical protein